MVWKKGQSGNPGGRPKAIEGNAARLARMIDEATDGGREIVNVLMKLLRKEAFTPAAEMRQAAIARMLFERWAGAPQQEITVRAEVGPSLPVDALDAVELDRLEIALAPIVAAGMLAAPKDPVE